MCVIHASYSICCINDNLLNKSVLAITVPGNWQGYGNLVGHLLFSCLGTIVAKISERQALYKS